MLVCKICRYLGDLILIQIAFVIGFNFHFHTGKQNYIPDKKKCTEPRRSFTVVVSWWKFCLLKCQYSSSVKYFERSKKILLFWSSRHIPGKEQPTATCDLQLGCDGPWDDFRSVSMLTGDDVHHNPVEDRRVRSQRTCWLLVTRYVWMTRIKIIPVSNLPRWMRVYTSKNTLVPISPNFLCKSFDINIIFSFI